MHLIVCIHCRNMDRHKITVNFEKKCSVINLVTLINPNYLEKSMEGCKRNRSIYTYINYIILLYCIVLYRIIYIILYICISHYISYMYYIKIKINRGLCNGHIVVPI